IQGLAALLKRDAQDGNSGWIMQEAEQQVVGADPAVSTSTRLLPSPDVGRPGVVQSPVGCHGRSFPYLAWMYGLVLPTASPICCKHQPAIRAARTWLASMRSASLWRATDARSPEPGSPDPTAVVISSMSTLSVWTDSVDNVNSNSHFCSLDRDPSNPV